MKITTINEQVLAALFPSNSTDANIAPIWNPRAVKAWLRANYPSCSLWQGLYSSDNRGHRDIIFYQV